MSSGNGTPEDNGHRQDSDANGRDIRTGRFLPGNPGGPGRKRNIDLADAARRYAKTKNIDLETAVGEIMVAMIGQAKEGDVHAAKLVLDRLCGPVRQEIDLDANVQHSGPTIPRGQEMMAWLAKLQEIAQEQERARHERN